MCWSLCFVGIQEAAQENMADVARRIDREAKKKREELTESVLQTSTSVGTVGIETSTVDSEEWKQKQLAQSFDRYWSSCHWAQSALRDFQEFAKGTRPRDPTKLLVHDSNESIALSEAFEDIIFPALKNRGWREQTPSTNSRKKKKLVGPDGSTVRESVIE